MSAHSLSTCPLQMCNVVPSGADAYGKLYSETSSDGVSILHAALNNVLRCVSVQIQCVGKMATDRRTWSVTAIMFVHELLLVASFIHSLLESTAGTTHELLICELNAHRYCDWATLCRTSRPKQHRVPCHHGMSGSRAAGPSFSHTQRISL